jgi:hypothetical protein
MAPYNALFISEVLCLIFEALAEDKAALARSAQSCRIFSNVSLDILWRSLVATKPLKDLVPPFKYAGEPVRDPIPPTPYLFLILELAGNFWKR